MIIVHFLAHRVVEHGVDREVAPPRVFLDRAENVVAQNAAMLVGHRLRRVGAFIGSAARTAKSRDLDGFGADHHVHETKAAADDARAAKHRAHLLGTRAGGDVEVLGLAPQQ